MTKSNQKQSSPPNERNAKRRGIAITEFALILPLILILVLGVIDLGLLTQSRLIISNVSREGGSIASRQIVLDNAVTSMLVASGKPIDLGGPDGKIFVTRIKAGTQNSGPTVDKQLTVGTLGSTSKIGAGKPNFGLTSAVYNHLVYNAANDAADIPSVTVVEVFYKYRPITGISYLIPGLLTSDGGGAIFWSKAVF